MTIKCSCDLVELINWVFKIMPVYSHLRPHLVVLESFLKFNYYLIYIYYLLELIIG